VQVESVAELPEAQVAVGTRLRVQAQIRLGNIPAGEVAVDFYLGRINAHAEISDGLAIPMQPVGERRGGVQTFEVAGVACCDSGLHGYTVRVMPFHGDESRSFLPGLVTWADGQAVAEVR
jgi:starch phosphorylase